MSTTDILKAINDALEAPELSDSLVSGLRHARQLALGHAATQREQPKKADEDITKRAKDPCPKCTNEAFLAAVASDLHDRLEVLEAKVFGEAKPTAGLSTHERELASGLVREETTEFSAQWLIDWIDLGAPESHRKHATKHVCRVAATAGVRVVVDSDKKDGEHE